jgi:hypothetical protein
MKIFRCCCKPFILTAEFGGANNHHPQPFPKALEQKHVAVLTVRSEARRCCCCNENFPLLQSFYLTTKTRRTRRKSRIFHKNQRVEYSVVKVHTFRVAQIKGSRLNTWTKYK